MSGNKSYKTKVKGVIYHGWVSIGSRNVLYQTVVKKTQFIVFIDICFNIDFPRMHTWEENGLKFLVLTVVMIGDVYVVIIF